MSLRLSRRSLTVAAAIALVAGGGATLWAQGDDVARGVAPIDSAGVYEVSGVVVDVSAKTAEAARNAGWRLAQRRAWQKLSEQMGKGGGLVSDGTLDSIVSGIVVDREEIGPTRYIARLGVLFDRARASGLLGVAAYAERSPAMLVIPVIWSGGVAQVFEQRSPWQEAWARYRTGGSAIDYVRPSGTGPDALILNLGQTERRSRSWWRAVIEQYGARDVLIPTVKLYRQWPGGPVTGVFEARHGPDNDLIGSVTLRVGGGDGLPALLDAGVKRLDDLYQGALRSGLLSPDRTLSPPPAPVAETPVETPAGEETVDPATLTQVSIQFDTPDAGAVAATETLVRSVAGVRSAVTASLALGGASVMRVAFQGDPATLKERLEARGLQVFGAGASLRIRRAPQLLPPDLVPDNSTSG